MDMIFHKYHGNGNDFILVDNRELSFDKDLNLIRKICHRHFGIGSDGIIFIEEHSNHDFNMDFYNPDGSQSFCGNGSRCSLHFAHELKMIEENATFNAIDGVHQGLVKKNTASISLSDVEEIERIGEDLYVNTGSPHYIKFVDNLEQINFVAEAKKIRYNQRFKEVGTNVNFVQFINNEIHSRTYERGVEDETYSSGTGTTAIAICSHLNFSFTENKVNVITRGGILEVSFNSKGGKYENIWLKGKVKHVYSGKFEI